MMNTRLASRTAAALIILGLGTNPLGIWAAPTPHSVPAKNKSVAAAVRSAPVVSPTRTPSTTTSLSIGALLSGKPYPTTMKTEQIDGTYVLVDLVDMQGKPGTYATKGDTVTMGSETFLVVYFLPTTTDPKQPKQPQPGGDAQLAFINMHSIQAILNSHSVVPVSGL